MDIYARQTQTERVKYRLEQIVCKRPRSPHFLQMAFYSLGLVVAYHNRYAPPSIEFFKNHGIYTGIYLIIGYAH